MKTRDMETVNASNERMPLLGNGSASNENKQTAMIATTSNEPWPLDENEANSKKKKKSNKKLRNSQKTKKETNEVSLEEVVEAMCSAWKRHRQPDPPADMYYFNIKELYAMHLAWKSVKKGRQCKIEATRIAEALGTAMAEVTQSVPEGSKLSDSFIKYQLDFTMLKNLFTMNLLEEWFDIIEGSFDDPVPVRYTETIFEGSEEPRPMVSKFCLRLVEMYDRALGFNRNYNFDVILHSFLIIWPISLLIIGSKYMECPMSHHLSRLLITLGCIGCLAIVYRLSVAYISILHRTDYRWYWRWKGLRLVEFTFLIVYVIQAYHFLKNHQTAEPDPTNCAENFYPVALVINYVSTPIVSAYVLTYFVKVYSHHFDVWHWIFRYF